LGEEAEGFEIDVALRLAVLNGPIVDGSTGDVVLKKFEIDFAAAFGGAEVIDAAETVDAADFEAVLAVRPCEGVGDVGSVAGGGPQGPTGIASEIVHISVAGVNAGKAEEARIGDASVEAVGSVGI